MVDYMIFDETGEEYYPEWHFGTRIRYGGSFIYVINAETVKSEASRTCWIWQTDPLENNKLYFIKRFGNHDELAYFEDIDTTISEAKGSFKKKLKNAKEMIEKFLIKKEN